MSRPSPVAVKTERLLNLVIALLYTRQPMTKARIRQAVPQYADSTDEAFDRMFERDKDELRAIGVPLRTEPVDAFFDDEPGYRIDRREYALPEIGFTPDELAVIGLASRSWSQASLAGPAARALSKLEASGLARDEASVAGIEPLLHTREPAFEAVRDAVLARREVRFGYRGPGAPEPAQRRVRPWRLTSWHGRWYLTGHDLDRDAPRVFRLDRMEGRVGVHGPVGDYEVPPEHDPRAMITASTQGRDSVRATVAVRPGTGHAVRRQGGATGSDEHGWDLLELHAPSSRTLVEEVAALGPDARVVHPPELAAAVGEHLGAVLAAHPEPAP